MLACFQVGFAKCFEGCIHAHAARRCICLERALSQMGWLGKRLLRRIECWRVSKSVLLPNVGCQFPSIVPEHSRRLCGQSKFPTVLALESREVSLGFRTAI